MADSALFHLHVSTSCQNLPPTILIGVTHAQTCLVLGARLRALRKAGFRVLLLSSPGPLLDQTAAREGVERIALPMQRGMAPFADLVALFRLWRLIGRCRPDLVEFSTPKAGLLGTLAAWLRGVPRRVYMLRGLKLEGTSGFKRRVLLAAERIAARSAHVVLCNSESLREEALALRVAHASKLRLLGEGSSNGVDIDRFSPGPSQVRKELGIPPSAPVIGFSGRLTRDKGLPELLEAFDLILAAEPPQGCCWWAGSMRPKTRSILSFGSAFSGIPTFIARDSSATRHPITAPWTCWCCLRGAKVSRTLCWKRRPPESPSSPRIYRRARLRNSRSDRPADSAGVSLRDLRSGDETHSRSRAQAAHGPSRPRVDSGTLRGSARCGLDRRLLQRSA